MPYNSVDELPKPVKDNLPESAQKVYVAAFNSAWTGTCKDDSNKDQCAARVAWGAVKRDYAKDDKGNWAKKSLVNDFSLHITKTSYDKKTGEMRWSAAASDTDKDLDEQAMTVELFDDFVSKANSGEKVPEPFQSEFWQGGMPYISVSHYPDLNGVGAAGIADKIYRDNKVLKATGKFFDTKLGKACFHATSKSLEEKSETPVRISIGFLDYKHTHEQNHFTFERKTLVDKCPICAGDSKNVLFLKGQLVHLALTRVPANERTSIEAEVTKSMTSRKEDAKSIIGEELADELDKKATLVGKSEALIVKKESDEPTPETVPSTEVPAPESEVTPEKPQEVVVEPVVEKPVEVPEEEEPLEVTEEPEDVVVDEKLVAKDAKASQKARSEKYGIAILAQGHVTKPGQWSDVPDSDWGDPVNYRYPMPDDAHIRNALSRFGQEQGSYKGKDVVQKRIEAKAKSAGIGAPAEKKSETVEPVVVDPVMEALSEIKKMLEPKPAVAHPLDEPIIQLKSTYDELMKNKSDAETVLTGLQPFMDKLGEVIKSSVKAEPAVEDAVTSENITMETVKSVISTELRPLADAIALLVQKQNGVVDVTRHDVPKPRNISATTVKKTVAEPKKSDTPHLDALLRKTTFVPSNRL